MGIESILGAVAGPVISTVAGGLFGGKGSSQSGTTTTTTQQQLDPRAAAILYGDGTKQGLLSQYQNFLNKPQQGGGAAFGNYADMMLGGQGSTILNQLQGGATSLLNGGPQSAAATPAGYYVNQGTQVKAPSQNNLDLSSAYANTIYGNAGANPYLTNALQSAVDQTNTAYKKNQTDLTNNLQRNILPGISSNAILSGGFGGSRQGIAQGNALSDYTNQLNNANLQLAQTNSANTTGAQAQAYNQGQDRSLAALQGLSGQQYGTASQNANLAQQANLQNQQLANNTSQFNSAQESKNNQFNAGLSSQNQQAGLAGLSGLLSNLYGYANNQNNYDINRASQVNGLLAPYLSLGGSTTSSQPYYQNTGANILGGATAGLGLYNGIKNAFGGSDNLAKNNSGLGISGSDLYSIFG